MATSSSMVNRGVLAAVLAGVGLSLWGAWRWLWDPSAWSQVVAGLLLSLGTLLYWLKTRPADQLVVEPKGWGIAATPWSTGLSSGVRGPQPQPPL